MWKMWLFPKQGEVEMCWQILALFTRLADWANTFVYVFATVFVSVFRFVYVFVFVTVFEIVFVFVGWYSPCLPGANWANTNSSRLIENFWDFSNWMFTQDFWLLLKWCKKRSYSNTQWVSSSKIYLKVITPLPLSLATQCNAMKNERWSSIRRFLSRVMDEKRSRLTLPDGL